MAFPVWHSIFIILLFLFPLYAFSQASPNVTLGSSLTANKGNHSWKSPSGEFAFGFIQIGSAGYLLAIWFNKIPERTIVWSANRNNLAPEGSKIRLLQDGGFVLSDSTGQQTWSANTTGAGIAYGAMLDSGNFVLANNTAATLWQTFHHPTDTLLPSQILGQSGKLVSSFSQANYSIGRYEFTQLTDGNVVLYTRNKPLDASNYAYWDTGSVGSGFQVNFNRSGSLYVTSKNGSLINNIFSDTASTSQFYQRVTLDYDGVLRHYLYPKSASSAAGRPMRWSTLEFTPPDICFSIAQDVGGGVCGFNSLCSLSDDRPVCKCPSGYTWIDPNDNLSGCKPNFVPQSCAQDLKETDLFGFVDLPHTDWPFGDIDHFQQVSEDWCRQVCLGDCFCAAAIYGDSGCWTKKSPLSNGRTDQRSTGAMEKEKAMLKIRKDNSTENGVNLKKKDRSVLIIIGSVLLGSSVLLNILLFVGTYFFRYWFSKRNFKLLKPSPVLPGLNGRSFSYSELEAATNGFVEELGRGACSIVYKGTLKHENGNLVAVKKLNGMIKEGEHEFNAEVSSISRTNHKNLVQLIGFCNDGQHWLLVYEFMSNGSLASYLFGNPRPNWLKRMQIALGTARGLCYLHEECSSQIIHCDIKPQNVLLDESLTAKISDFGMAKLLKPDQTKTTTAARGTRGYVAPEWFRSMPVTAKVDVYSFGILLLELICCRKNVEKDVKDEKEMILSDWAYDCYNQGKLYLLIARDEEAQDDFNTVEKFVITALWCIQEDPSLRPTMKRVMQMLEGSVLVPVPPSLSSFISSIDSMNN